MIGISDDLLNPKEYVEAIEELLNSTDAEADQIENQPLESHDSVQSLDIFEALRRFGESSVDYEKFSRIFVSSYFGLVKNREQIEIALNDIFQSSNQGQVLDILSEVGFEREVSEFQKELAEIEEDDESSKVCFESLKAAARFLVTYDVPFSPIEVDHNGDIVLEWMLSADKEENHEDDIFWGEGDSHFILRFISSNLIEFALSSGPWDGDRERMVLSGRLSHSKMDSILDMFRERIISFD